MRMLGAIPTGALTQPPRFDSNDTFACPQPLEDESPFCVKAPTTYHALSPAWSARRLIRHDVSPHPACTLSNSLTAPPYSSH